MKIGLFNIFTAFWFLLMVGGGSTLSYTAILDNVLASDLIFIAKFFLIVLFIVTLGTLIFFLLKFRLLIITNNKIISIRPFVAKIEEVNLKEIKKITWKSWELKATIFKTVELIGPRNNCISISDFEFENFERLTSKIPQITFTDKRSRIYQEQAKRNLPITNFIIVIGILFIGTIFRLNMIENEFHWFQLMFYFSALILIIASFKRRIKYKKIIKTAHNTYAADKPGNG